MDLTFSNPEAKQFHDYLLVVEGSSRRLENRIRRYAKPVFKGYFANGLIIYHLKFESFKNLRRLKLSLKGIENYNKCRVLKFEPLLKRDDIILMMFLHIFEQS